MFGKKSDSMLEPEFAEPYAAWKQLPSQAANAAILKTIHPVIEGAIRTHVGNSNPLLLSRARGMALQGLQSYDPKQGRLQTHLYNHLQGLKRVNRQQTTVLRVPERIALDRFNLGEATKELTNQLNREPTDDELSNHTGFSRKRIAKVNTYSPAMAEGTVDEATGGAGVMGALHGALPPHSTWSEIIYDELDPYHKKIMELTFGLHGRRPLANHEIAERMQRSPGAISQAKLRIQKMLDEEHELGAML